MRVVEADLDEKGLGHYYMQAPSEPGPRAQGTGESLGECQGLCLTRWAVYYMQAPSEPGPGTQGTGKSLGECKGLCLTNGLYITCRHQVSLGLELKGLERA